MGHEYSSVRNLAIERIIICKSFFAFHIIIKIYVHRRANKSRYLVQQMQRLLQFFLCKLIYYDSKFSVTLQLWQLTQKEKYQALHSYHYIIDMSLILLSSTKLVNLVLYLIVLLLYTNNRAFECSNIKNIYIFIVIYTYLKSVVLTIKNN